MNLSLWRIKQSPDDSDSETEFQLPNAVPLIGFVACAVVLVYRVWDLAT